MPILPFPELPKPPGAGSDGGGFSPPQCPITTVRTTCEPSTISSCNCVNHGPKIVGGASSWTVDEVGASGDSGTQYLSGTVTTTNGKLILNGLPRSWNAPSYSYTGYMKLKIYCGNGSEQVLESWTTINGQPTHKFKSRFLDGSYSNPCGPGAKVQPDMDLAQNEKACNQMALDYPDFDISWDCTQITVDVCKETNITTFVDAQIAADQAGLLGALFFGAIPAMSNQERVKLLSEMLKNFKGYDLSDKVIGYKELYTNGKLTGMGLVWGPKPGSMSDKAWESYKKVANKLVDDLNKNVNKFTSSGKADDAFRELLRKSQNNKSLLKNLGKKSAIAGILAILLFGSGESLDAAIIDMLTDPNTAGDAEIRYECPDPGGNNTGDTTGGEGNPDGSISLPNGQQIGPSYNGSPSRGNFFYKNNSSININSLNGKSAIPSFVSNNKRLNKDEYYLGSPTTSFPIIKSPLTNPNPSSPSASYRGVYIDLDNINNVYTPNISWANSTGNDLVNGDVYTISPIGRI